jgi:hypothetical protein
MSSGDAQDAHLMDAAADVAVIETAGEPLADNLPSLTPADIAQRLSSCGDTLNDICEALEIEVRRLGQFESIEQVEITTEAPADTVMAWDIERIEAWFSVLTTDLKLRLKLEGLDLEGLDPGYSGVETDLAANQGPGETFTQFRGQVQALQETQGNDLYVHARVTVRKTRVHELAATLLALRPAYLGTPDMLKHTKSLIFYSASAWHRLLTLRAIWNWETEGIVEDERRLFVILCDSAGYAGGVAIEVFGARLQEDVAWVSLSRAAWRQFLTRARNMLHLHTEESYWDSAP